jgi:hypothetical protein
MPKITNLPLCDISIFTSSQPDRSPERRIVGRAQPGDSIPPGVSEEAATILVSPIPKLTSERKKEYRLRCATRVVAKHDVVECCTAGRTVQERIQETQSGLSSRHELKEYNND